MSSRDEQNANALRAEYAEYLATYQQRRLDTARDGAAESGSSGNSNGDESPPSDDDFPDYMDSMQDYLEFVILQRNCAAARLREGLPAIQCTRHEPCPRCSLHDGSYVTSVHWHFMSDAELQRHLAEYMRIRDELPPWQSSRPANVLPPRLMFGVTPRAANFGELLDQPSVAQSVETTDTGVQTAVTTPGPSSAISNSRLDAGRSDNERGTSTGGVAARLDLWPEWARTFASQGLTLDNWHGIEGDQMRRLVVQLEAVTAAQWGTVGGSDGSDDMPSLDEPSDSSASVPEFGAAP